MPLLCCIIKWGNKREGNYFKAILAFAEPLMEGMVIALCAAAMECASAPYQRKGIKLVMELSCIRTNNP